jgi:hypothetical protein
MDGESKEKEVGTNKTRVRKEIDNDCRKVCWEITEIPLIIIIKALAPSPIA